MTDRITEAGEKLRELGVNFPACHTPAECIAVLEEIVAEASPQPWVAHRPRSLDAENIIGSYLASGSRTFATFDTTEHRANARVAALGARMVGPAMAAVEECEWRLRTYRDNPGMDIGDTDARLRAECVLADLHAALHEMGVLT